MRGKVAKGLRKSVYGNRKDRKEKLKLREYKITDKGVIFDANTANRTYKLAKTKWKETSHKIPQGA